MNMNLVELKTFLSVIEEKGITAASKKLNITQPAISKRLENLKYSFGIKELFTRKSGELIISKDAQALIPYAKNIIALIENAQNEVNNYVNGKKGKISIGSGAGWITGNLPDAIARTIEKYPGLHVDFNVDTPDLQLQKLIDNKIDILFARKPENLDYFEYKTLRHDRYIIIASKKHPLTKRDNELKDLISYKFAIATTSQQTEDLFFNCFTSKKLVKPTISVSTNSLRMGLNCLYESSLLLFTQANIFESYNDPRLAILNIKDFNITRETGVITRKGYQSLFFKELMQNLNY
jgi:DNA-binding transcriptional LysR family regulator